MSHFTVLVIGEKDFEEALYPFWELDLSQEEMISDPRAVFVDETEEYLRQYNKDGCSEFYCASSSSWGSKVDKNTFDKIKKSPIGKKIEYIKDKSGFDYFKKDHKYCLYYEINGRRCKNRNVWIQITDILETSYPDKSTCFEGKVIFQHISPPKRISFKKQYKTFEMFLKDWIYPTELNGRYGYFHNPNAKWDWCKMGGLWAGFFKLKENRIGIQGYHRAKDFAEIDGKKIDDLPKDRVDQVYKKDIDFEYMKNEEAEKSRNLYLGIQRIFDGEMPKLKFLWKDILDDKNIEDISQKRKKYWNQLANKKLKEVQGNIYKKDKKSLSKAEEYLIWNDLEEFQCSIDEYVQRKKDKSIITFAVIKDGEWYEKGEMGWWGNVSDEKNDEIWIKEFNKLIDDLPDDILLTVVDCHI